MLGMLSATITLPLSMHIRLVFTFQGSNIYISLLFCYTCGMLLCYLSAESTRTYNLLIVMLSVI